MPCAAEVAVSREVLERGEETEADADVHVHLEKVDGERLGFVIMRTRVGCFLGSIEEGGALAYWNLQHPSTSVRVGDRIVSLNGVTGSKAIVVEAWQAKTVDIVLRPSGLPPSDGSRYVQARKSVDDYARVRGADSCSSECAICLESFAPETQLVELPCRHAFHSSCLSHWLAGMNSCPCCRLSLPMVDQQLRT
eukprot:TRINITY_DN12790_c0_g1_i1.p1 TRINITY_DN12790_c0_g1~~TRINITY_DN12790_c0_g1_i1.p1  ORF type:complete len:194 (-),score=20.17 TRINITY_DN12790_c0_g1_i1:530-1111(-)